jgi:hypothetical protein
MKRASAESRLLDSPSRRTHVTVVGRCRVCGCTDLCPCINAGVPCSWVDAEHTLCNSVECVARVPLRELEVMTPAC